MAASLARSPSGKPVKVTGADGREGYQGLDGTFIPADALESHGSSEFGEEELGAGYADLSPEEKVQRIAAVKQERRVNNSIKQRAEAMGIKTQVGEGGKVMEVMDDGTLRPLSPEALGISDFSALDAGVYARVCAREWGLCYLLFSGTFPGVLDAAEEGAGMGTCVVRCVLLAAPSICPLCITKIHTLRAHRQTHWA